MSNRNQIINCLKQQLKSQQITYAQLGEKLSISEAAVKAMFVKENMSLVRLEQIATILGFDLSEIMQLVDNQRERIHQLSTAQEQLLIDDESLLLIATCVINQMSADEIVRRYTVDYSELRAKFKLLADIQFIELLNDDRYRLLIANDFHWQADGPIRDYFKTNLLGDFFDTSFNNQFQTMSFNFGMLSSKSIALLIKKCQQLSGDFNSLYFDDLKLELDSRRGTSMVIALRPWLPANLQKFERKS